MSILSLILALLGLLGAGISGGRGGGGGSGSFSSGGGSFIVNPPAIIQPLGEEIVLGTDYGDAPPPYGIASHTSQNSDWLGDSVSEDPSYGGSGWVDEFDDGVSWSPFNFIPGQSASISFIVTAYNPSEVAASWHQYVRIWVDWDQSGTWEADENILSSDSDYWHRYVADLAPDGLLQEEVTQEFLVPSDALTGTTWLRARLGRGIMGPASAVGYGEAEDYHVNVVTPEPATLLLFGVGFSGLWLIGKRRRSVN